MAKTETKKKKRINWEDRPPSLDLRGKNFLPDIKDWQIDDEVELVIKAKLTRKEEGSYPDYGMIGCCDDDCDCGDDHETNRKKKQSASFEVISIKSNGKLEQPKSGEAGVAARYNANIKKGMKPEQAMTLAKRG